MTGVDRDIGLALLKRLYKRGLITEETYVSACNSRVFDVNRFFRYAESINTTQKQEDCSNDDNSTTT